MKKIFFHKFDIIKCTAKDLKRLTKGIDIIINCAGIIKPYINENDIKSIERALTVNSIFPHRLNDIVKKPYYSEY